MKLIVACALPGVPVPMVGAPGAVAAITIEKACVAEPAELVAVTTPVKVPAAVGVPLSTPEEELSDKPEGSAPDVTLNVGAGEPLAVYVCEYATLKVPPGGAAFVNAGPRPGVTLTVPDAALAPTALFAWTEHVYVMPFVRPVTVTGEPAPGPVIAPGLQGAVELGIAEPPLEAGALKPRARK